MGGGTKAATDRAAWRVKTKAGFFKKLDSMKEEATETLFWMELLTECKKVSLERTQPLQKEMDELVAIFSTSHTKAKENRKLKL
jgi:four helix bundle protein